MVQAALDTRRRSPRGAAAVGDAAEATHNGGVSPQARGVEATRLAVGQRELMGEGYSHNVARRAVAKQAKSTQHTYDARWNTFTKYCQEQGVDPFKASKPIIADFLVKLFEAGKASSTVDGYKAAIASTLKHTKRELIGKDPVLTDLMANLRQERPPKSVKPPPWDLKLVLMALMKEPFEPMGDPSRVSLQLLTWKTVFLTLLASGGRRGEVHAIEYNTVRHSKDWKSVTLQPHVDFISKTHVRSGGAQRLDHFKILSIADFVGPDLEKDRKLCPVRALKIYLARTQNMRNSTKLLFISYRPEHKGDICKNTISGWVRKLIQFVYKNADQETATLAGTKTHHIRAMAASLAYRGGVDVEDLLRACHWKHETTFTSFYLKDVSLVRDSLSVLGPLSVAQHVLQGK